MNKKIILLLPALSGMMWGFSGVFVRKLSECGFNNFSILSTRVVGATLVLFLLLLIIDRDSLKIKLKDLWLFLGTGILATLAGNLCYIESTCDLSLSFAALLLGLAPIFALIFSIFLFNEKLTYKKIICLAVALFGCILVSGLFENVGFKCSTSGIIFGILSAVFWAMYGIFSKLASNKGYSILTILFYSFLVISISLVPFTQWDVFAKFLVSNPIIDVSVTLTHSVFTLILPYLFFSYSLTKLDNSIATILCSSAEPTFATIIGALMFAEIPTLLNVVGIIVTIGSIAMLIHLEVSS